MLRAWYGQEIREAPTWHFVLEAAGNDPLRAQEIEERLSSIWWQRWLVDRDIRLQVIAQRPVGPGRHTRGNVATSAHRQRYRILPDGQLVAA